MKKLVSIFAILMLGYGLYAQTSTTSAVTSVLGPRNAIKTNIAAYYPLTTANIYYEFKVSNKVSVGTGFGYKIPQTFEVSGIADLADEEDDFTWTGDVEPEGLYVNPYVRFYPKGAAITGLYFEAFLRYYKYTMKIPYTYTDDTDPAGNPMPEMTYNEKGDGEADGYGGGFMIGNQFALGPTMVVDIYAGFGLASGSFYAESQKDSQMGPDDYADAKQEIDDAVDAQTELNIPFMDKLVNAVEADASSTKVWAEIKDVAFPMIRFGVVFGGAF